MYYNIHKHLIHSKVWWSLTNVLLSSECITDMNEPQQHPVLTYSLSHVQVQQFMTRLPTPLLIFLIFLTAACWACGPASLWPRRQLWYPWARPAAGGCEPCRAGRSRTAPWGRPSPPSAAWRPWRAARCARGTAAASSWRRWGETPHSRPPIHTGSQTCSGTGMEVRGQSRR